MRKKKKGAVARVWGISRLGNKTIRDPGRVFLTHKETRSRFFGSLGMGLF